MLFNTEGAAIRTILSGQEPGGLQVGAWQMLIFITIWYLLTIVTYGVWVPAGLFLPGMIIGCAVGSLYETIEKSVFGEATANPSVLPVIIASGAMLAGYTRLSYSLLMIMLETTTCINLFIPMMIGILTSRAVSKPFTRSLYERALRTK
jgi:H+/Cl- antiporter ClcA